ncbi:MAG: universal stress protein [Candidatus Pacebacteria bacterium]|nr:universal stress protein [Candidatus Paceibacterota bacterium]
MDITIHKILCPVDFSVSSYHALEYAIAFAEKYKAELKVVYVMEVAAAALSLSEVDVTDPGLLEQLQSDANDKLDQIAKETRERHEPVTQQMLYGKPFVEIITAAKDWQADVIIMGTHGRTGLEHVLIGSVAEKVVRKAPCPVLTVRHPEHNFVMP